MTKGCLFRKWAPLCDNLNRFTFRYIRKQLDFSSKPAEFHFTAWSSYASAVLGNIILSICPSVRPSVCHTRALWRNEQKIYCQYFDTTWKGNHSNFLIPTEFGGRCPASDGDKNKKQDCCILDQFRSHFVWVFCCVCMKQCVNSRCLSDSWPGWLTYSGRITHISGHPSGRAQDRQSSPAKDRRSTSVPHSQLSINIVIATFYKSSA